ncbi:MAG: anti-sigma factor family protein [Myxococcales bacterium]
MTCQELVELVTDYLEGQLPEQQRLKFEEHLSWCPPCVTYIDQIKSIGRLTSRLNERDVPTSVRDALLEAFRHWKSHRC